MRVEARLEELGLVLPEPLKPPPGFLLCKLLEEQGSTGGTPRNAK